MEGALVDNPFSFTADTSRCGWGELKVDIVHSGKSVPHQMTNLGDGLHKISFAPIQHGKHRVYTYFNGIECKGSPFRLRVYPSVDISKVSVVGEALQMAPVGQKVNFELPFLLNVKF